MNSFVPSPPRRRPPGNCGVCGRNGHEAACAVRLKHGAADRQPPAAGRAAHGACAVEPHAGGCAGWGRRRSVYASEHSGRNDASCGTGRADRRHELHLRRAAYAICAATYLYPFGNSATTLRGLVSRHTLWNRSASASRLSGAAPSGCCWLGGASATANRGSSGKHRAPSEPGGTTTAFDVERPASRRTSWRHFCEDIRLLRRRRSLLRLRLHQLQSRVIIAAFTICWVEGSLWAHGEGWAG